MIGVLAPVFGLALFDSLNPSAIAITLYLLLSGGSFVPRVASYAAGIFCANLVFVSPPLLLMGAYRLFGARLRPTFERWKEKLQSAGREALPWILGIAGFLLLADSLRYFEFFGLV